VTHVIVKESSFPWLERSVPVGMVVEASPDEIRLSCTGEELHGLESFLEAEFVPGHYPYGDYDLGEYHVWPYIFPEEEPMPVEHERVPPGELAVRRGSHVQAKDGAAGRVDEFLVDRETGHITHLVLREGHLWGQKDVLVPVSAIGQIDEDEVYLILSKAEVANLPKIPVQRWHGDLGQR